MFACVSRMCHINSIAQPTRLNIFEETNCNSHASETLSRVCVCAAHFQNTAHANTRAQSQTKKITHITITICNHKFTHAQTSPESGAVYPECNFPHSCTGSVCACVCALSSAACTRHARHTIAFFASERT